MLALDVSRLSQGVATWTAVGQIPSKSALSSEGISLLAAPAFRSLVAFGGYNGAPPAPAALPRLAAAAGRGSSRCSRRLLEQLCEAAGGLQRVPGPRPLAPTARMHRQCHHHHHHHTTPPPTNATAAGKYHNTVSQFAVGVKPVEPQVLIDVGPATGATPRSTRDARAAQVRGQGQRRLRAVWHTQGHRGRVPRQRAQQHLL
jgi:hypothetical protein